ncbi:hypothetical protein [Roseateles sp.]|uniref:hypothetical protein n=1 Tax=Roseateles sp. TaxID=1971397 RepID=UPI0031D043C9
MSVSAEDFLKVSRVLRHSDSEPWWRVAASRAYYASYHCSRIWERQLPKSGDDQGRRGVHESLIARLLNPDGACRAELASRSRRIGEHLAQQRTLRVKADYKIDHDVSARMLVRQLELAELVFSDCAGKGVGVGPSSRRRRPGGIAKR